MPVFFRFSWVTLSFSILVNCNANAGLYTGFPRNPITPRIKNKPNININKCNSLFEIVNKVEILNEDSKLVPLSLLPQTELESVFHKPPSEEDISLRQRIHEVAVLQAAGNQSLSEVHEKNMLIIAKSLSELHRLLNKEIWNDFVVEALDSRSPTLLLDLIYEKFHDFPDIDRIRSSEELRNAALDLIFILKLHSEYLNKIETEKLVKKVMTSKKGYKEYKNWYKERWGDNYVLSELHKAEERRDQIFFLARPLVIAPLISSYFFSGWGYLNVDSNYLVELLSFLSLHVAIKQNSKLKETSHDFNLSVSEIIHKSESNLKRDRHLLPQLSQRLTNDLAQIDEIKPSLYSPPKSEVYSYNNNPFIERFLKEMGKSIAGQFSIGSDFEEVMAYQSKYRDLIHELLDLNAHFAQNDILVRFFRLGRFNYSEHVGLEKMMSDPVMNSDLAEKLRFMIKKIGIVNPIEIKSLLYSIIPWLSEVRLDQYYSQLRTNRPLWKAEDYKQVTNIVDSIGEYLLEEQAKLYGFINSENKDDLFEWKQSIHKTIEILLAQNSNFYGHSFIDFFINHKSSDHPHIQSNFSQSINSLHVSNEIQVDFSNGDSQVPEKITQDADWFNSPGAETLRSVLKKVDINLVDTEKIVAALLMIKFKFEETLNNSNPSHLHESEKNSSLATRSLVGFMMPMSSSLIPKVVNVDLLKKIEPPRSLESSSFSNDFIHYAEDLAPYFYYVNYSIKQTHKNALSITSDLKDLQSKYFPSVNLKYIGNFLNYIRQNFNFYKVSQEDIERLELNMTTLKLNLEIERKKIGDLEEIISELREKVLLFQQVATSFSTKENVSISNDQTENLLHILSIIELEYNALISSEAQLSNDMRLLDKASIFLISLQSAFRHVYTTIN